jgi:hypothetical protein
MATGNLEEKKEMKFTKLAIFATLLTMASTSFAGTSATSTNVVQPTLQVNATVVDAVQLTLAQGTSGSACTFSAGSGTDYQMSFGTVDALAINSGCGSKYTPAQTGSDAVYYTDYQLKPVFTSQPNITNPTITAYVSSNFAASNIKIVRDTANSSAAPAANGFSAMSTNSGSPDSLASAVASGTPLTRYIGVDINNSNGSGLTGSQSATVTFTLTVN